MTAAEAVETSVTNSLSQDYTNMDDLPSLTCTDSPGLKPFILNMVYFLVTLLAQLYKEWKKNVIHTHTHTHTYI